MKIHFRRFFLLVALAATFTALASAQEPATPATPKPKPSPALKLNGISGSASVTLDPSIPGIVRASQVTGVMTELVVFGCPVLIVALMVFGRYRRAQLLHETLRVMVEKGAAIPPELLVPPKPPANDFRRGILLVSLGAGLIGLLSHSGRGAWAVGLVPLLLGAGYLVLAKLGEKPPRRSRPDAALVSDPADAELIARVLQHGDERAYAGLVARHQEFLRHFLRRLTANDHAAADDLAQEAFIRAWQKLETYRGDASWRSWLCGIAYRLFLTQARRKAPLDRTDELSPDREEAAVSSPPGLAMDLEQAIALLSDAERAAITLCYQSGCSHEEASTALGLPLGTLKTHLFRAKEKLRHSLASWNPR